MRQFLLFLFITFQFSFLAQKADPMLSKLQLTRVQLKEKFNLPGRSLPKSLLKAYCEGLIKAYYPFDVNKECSYYEFASHFNYSKIQPIPSPDEFSNLECPMSFCGGEKDPVLADFQMAFDLFEEKRFDKALSAEKISTRYVRLLYAREKAGTTYFIQGPVFLYEDIIQLTRDDLKIPNPKNAGANFSIKQYLEGRMFHGIVIKNNTSVPEEHLLERKDKNKDKEKDNWHY